jgi:hypothetical protein
MISFFFFNFQEEIICLISQKVHFVISGDNEETGVRTFADPHRTILQRGGIDSFIMAVSK